MERKKSLKIVKSYTHSVLTERVGGLEGKEVQLRYKMDFKLLQPPQQPVFYHYQERLSVYLSNMRRTRVIEDVDLTEKVDFVLKVTISEKYPGDNSHEQRHEALE